MTTTIVSAGLTSNGVRLNNGDAQYVQNGCVVSGVTINDGS